MGRLGRVLEPLGPSWSVLERSKRCLGGVLGRPGRVLGRFKRHKRERGGRDAARLWPWGTLSFKDEQREQEQEENLQTSSDQVHAGTQTRSWAPSGPVRIQSAAQLRTRHSAKIPLRLNFEYISEIGDLSKHEK